MKTPMPHCAGVPLAVLLGVFLFPSVPTNAAEVVSATPRPSLTAQGHSLYSSLNADGRLVAFVSQANNLVTNDDNRLGFDVFVRDLNLGSTVLASVSTNGFGGGDGDSVGAVLAASARRVAFTSAAANLVAGDTNRLTDVFVRDLDQNLTILGSAGTNGMSGLGASSNPFLSDDGRYLYFESDAPDLVPMDTNGTRDIFVRDLASNVTSLVNIDTTAAGTNIGPTELRSISADGSRAALFKRANNIVGGKFSSFEIYVRDQASGTTFWASRDVASLSLSPVSNWYLCFPPILTRDGRYVIFAAYSFGYYLVRHHLETGTTETIPGNWPDPNRLEVSRDGGFVSFESGFGISMWDVASATNRLISQNLYGLRTASAPSLALDASRVAFLVQSNGTHSVFTHDWSNGQTWLVSSRTTGTMAAVDPISGCQISSDGRAVLFSTLDPGLVADDRNHALDVFVNELAEERLTPVSLRTSTLESLTPALPSRNVAHGINPSGRTVALSTYATDWGFDDTNGAPDILVRDLSGGAFTFLGATNGGSRQARLSADGRYVAWARFGLQTNTEHTVAWQDRLTGSNFSVRSGAGSPPFSDGGIPFDLTADGHLLAFQSDAPIASLVPGFQDANGLGADIYVRDMRTGTNQLISVNRFGTNTGNQGSSEPRFSPDGRWLTFRSAATNLALPAVSGLFARDLVSNATLIINTNFTLTTNPATRFFSWDSRFIASASWDYTIGLFDFLTRTSATLCASCQNPSLSADGRWLAYETVPAGTNTLSQVMVLDRTSATVETISRSEGGDFGNNHSRMPSISHDGRYVVFASRANNLVANDTNNTSDIFVRDRWRGVPLLASMNLSGAGPGNGPSVNPVLAADGRTLTFQSFASDLISGDFNDTSDVFVFRLGGPDTDHDGLEDDWEVAYFNTMERDGTGDFDTDGASDAAEFHAGTDPTNAGKVLRMRTLSTALASVSSTRTTRLAWDAIPGRTYRIDYKATVDSAWQVVSDSLVAAGTLSTYTHASNDSASHGFYRVVLVLD